MKHSDHFMNKVAEDLIFEAFDIALKPVLETIRHCTIPSLRADLIHRVIDKALELQDPGPCPPEEPTGSPVIAEPNPVRKQLLWPYKEQP